MRILISICLLALCCAGCKGIPVKTARDYYNAVSPRYLKSIENDPRLTDEQKRILRQPDASFKRVLAEAK